MSNGDSFGLDLDLDEHGIVGQFYPSQRDDPSPAVHLIGGSDGGLDKPAAIARALGAHHLPSLAVAYFKVPGLPDALRRIDLTYLESALTWLRAQGGVDPHRVLVIGITRK